MSPDPVAVSAMYATWAQAGASVLTLLIAIGAAFSWYETLRSQRSDETVGAAINFRSCVGRYLSSKEAELDSTGAYDAAWDAQSNLSQKLAIQKRYDDFPGDDITRSVYNFMRDKIAPTISCTSISHDAAEKLNTDCEQIANRIRGQMRPGIVMRVMARSRAAARRRSLFFWRKS